ncbi:hypothetical protein D8674_011764 [Pyrus ussuriensis x Pyrus communis]|uniref:Uncharacterized protein n=1 Tax=Pyrus ussuriensis x Pyrus communis TaxID=2448454 RepID=A0A5N5FZR8_9ROSA|nr:hypothetical protein D8674_011764 [Pyrus ussuriensis x Pyrus communis]
MEARLLGCGLKVFSYIQPRIKTLKAKYFTITELLALSGFEGNKEKMMFVCEKSVYYETTKGKKDASGLYDKAFPHYHTLGKIYAKDRVVGANASNVDNKEEEVRLEDANVNVNENEGEDESGYDVDTYFLVPNTLQRQNAESNTSNSGHKRARVGDEIAHQFSAMAKDLMSNLKFDGLVHAFSTDINLTQMQQKLDGELNKIEILAPMKLFQFTNFLAKEYNLLRVFFTMSDERKSAYDYFVANLDA